MKILFIRHAEPDYTIDSLTEKGWREAALLARRLEKEPIAAAYVSPLGRARDTASLSLEKLGMTAEVCPWLREFDAPIDRPDNPDEKKCPWDWLPGDWLARPELLLEDGWYKNERMMAGHVHEAYRWVTESFDELLARHGYVREGRYYRAERPNMDTIALFCHFGVTCVLLSHLMNVSPMILWHGLCAAPSSVTTTATEERREGVASFRTLAFGDTSHLYIENEPISFSARFCECWTNQEERHD